MDGLKPAGALMLLMIVSDPGMFQTLGQLLKSAFPKLTISPAGDGYLTITAPGLIRDGRLTTLLVPEFPGRRWWPLAMTKTTYPY